MSPTPSTVSRFNGVVPAAGTYSRASVAYARSGEIASGDYLPGKRATNAAPRSAWTVGHTWTGNARFMGAGVLHDNSTNAAAWKLQATSVVNAYEGNLDTTARTLAITTATKPDLLQGGVASYYYDPKSGALIHGMYVTVCAKTLTATDSVEAIGVTISQDGFATTPTLLGDGDTFQAGLDRGREWNITWAPTTGGPTSAPTDIVVMICDYINDGGTKTGGQVYFFRATRSSATGTWTTQALRKLDEQTGTGLHSHTAIYSSGSVYAFWGDGAEQNGVFRYSFDGGINSYTTSTITKTQVHGGQGATAAQGSQSVGAVQLASDKWAVGADVTLASIYTVTLDGDNIDIDAVYGTPFLSERGYDSLFLHGTGPYVAKSNPTVQASLSQEYNRVLFSQNGVDWCAIAQGSSTTADGVPFVFGSKVALLDTGGVSYMAQPSVSTFSPLRLGDGITNLLKDADPTTAGVGAGNTVTLIDKATLTPSAPTPLDNVLRIQGGTTNIQLGRHTITTGSAVATGDVTVLVWIKCQDGQGARVRYRIGDGSNFTAFGVLNVESTTWEPLRIQGDPGATGAYDLSLQLQSDSTARDTDYYIAFGGVWQGDVEIPYVGPAAAASEDSSYSEPITLADQWTVVLDCVVPEYGWDSTRSDGDYWLMSIVKDASNAQEVYANTAANRLQHKSRYAGAATTTFSSNDSAYYVPGDVVRVALKYDGTTYTSTAIVNGNEAVSTTGDTKGDNITGACTLYLGANFAGTVQSPIEVMQVAVYDEALSTSEIVAVSPLASSTSPIRRIKYGKLSGIIGNPLRGHIG